MSPCHGVELTADRHPSDSRLRRAGLAGWDMIDGTLLPQMAQAGWLQVTGRFRRRAG
jgi:hypothetical protein